jgi:hypothetical protein
VTVEFGPSRSKRFGRAVAEARSGAGECREAEPGRYRASFVLGTDSDAYTGLARLLERVRHWRTTEVFEGSGPVSAYHAKEMAWCASSQLQSFGGCRFRFYYGIFPRCSFCPLFDAERAIRDALGESPPPDGVWDRVWPKPSRPAGGRAPPGRRSGIRPGLASPDFPPEEWAEPAGEEPPG